VRPFFSVLVPVYRTEHFLEQCLRSVKAQTFGGWECVVVNDGSTGAPPERWGRGQAPSWSPKVELAGVPLPEQARRIFDAVAEGDARFRYVAQVNAGLGEARNAGLRHAEGERVVLLDSDDYLAPDYLERARAAIVAHPRGVVHGDLTCLVNGEPRPFSALGRVPRPNNLRTMLVYPAWTMTPINYFWPVDALRAEGIAFVKHRGEDSIFNLDNLLAHTRRGGRLEFINTGGRYWYRRFGEQMSVGATFAQEQLESMRDYVRGRAPDFAALGLRYRALAELFAVRQDLYLRRMHSDRARTRWAYNVVAKGLSAVSALLSGARSV
jgi:glycosyltransferase involved in cell wall biosynthesis